LPIFRNAVRPRPGSAATERGISLKPVDLSDLVLYGTYQGVAGAAQGWGMKPGGQGLHEDLSVRREAVPAGDVHIEQVLEQAARNSEAPRAASGGLAGIVKSAVDRLH
jgi:hypothetical protein